MPQYTHPRPCTTGAIRIATVVVLPGRGTRCSPSVAGLLGGVLASASFLLQDGDRQDVSEKIPIAVAAYACGWKFIVLWHIASLEQPVPELKECSEILVDVLILDRMVNTVVAWSDEDPLERAGC